MMHCYICKEDTISVEPFVIRRVGVRITVSCICKNCGFTKSRFLEDEEQNKLPFNPLRIAPLKTYINKILCKGKLYILSDYTNNIINI